ncbi:hypothetical protein Tco_0014745 [Tanacetum coccineum]
MAETMKQFMSKTRANYGSGVARPKIEDKDHFELKGQFLKELRENTFSGSNHEDANEHIEKVLEIILDSRGAILTKTTADVKVAIQEMVEYSQRWHIGTSKTRSTKTYDGLAAIQAQLNNLGREIKKVNENVYVAQEGDIKQQIRDSIKGTTQILLTKNEASMDASIRNQGASITTLKIQIGQMSKNRTLMYETRQTTIPFPCHLNGYYCDEKKGSYGPQLSEAYSEASHIDNSIPRKEKYPGSFTLPCFINNVCFDNALVDLGANVSVMPLSTYLNLGLGELAHNKLIVELADRTVNYPKGIAKNVLVGIGKFVFPVDFIILNMPEDIKVPLILGRPFLSTAHAKIDVFKPKITLRVREERIIFKSVKPASSLIKRVYMISLRERMELDLEARLIGDTLMINRSLDPLNEDYIKLNDLNEPFELTRSQGDDLMPNIKEGEVIEEFRTRDDELDTGINDYPSCCDFLEDMDAYRDEGIGNVIFGKPFLREVGIKTRWFEGMITIYNGNESVSDEDKKNGISHPYQKLKGFYKGVLNLGLDYIRDAKTEEWLIREHISVHEMEW